MKLQALKTKQTLKERFERTKGVVGRPKVVSDEDRNKMLDMLKHGLSRYKIAEWFKGKYSRRTVYRVLS